MNIQAILDNPTDIELRLVYSDWLEENGELDFANLIRNPNPLAEEVKKVYPLFEKYAIVNEKHYLDNCPAPAIYFNRGFVERIKTTFSSYIASRDYFLKYHPILWWQLGNKLIAGRGILLLNFRA